jgi:hypothetical protein
MVHDDTHDGEEYEVNRLTGQAANTDYFVHVYYLEPIAGHAHAALTLQASGHNPETDTVFN